MGKLLIAAGLLLVAAGLLLWGLESVLGRNGLPGDLQFGGRGWRVFIPLGTAVLVSLILTILLNLILWLVRRP